MNGIIKKEKTATIDKEVSTNLERAIEICFYIFVYFSFALIITAQYYSEE